jgi:two-component system, sensor histidine kinase PdtaS
MFQYLCYFVRKDGVTAAWRAFQGESDGDAQDYALGMILGFPHADKVEVWNDSRLVLNHSRPATQTPAEMRRSSHLAVAVARRETDPKTKQAIASYAAQLAQEAEALERQTVTIDERELAELRGNLARAVALLHQKDELIQQLEALGQESEHRMLNGLQMIVSLLSLRSRASLNPEAAVQLADAANRVAMVECIHRHLHCLDGATTIALKQYLEDICRDFSRMLSSIEHPVFAIAIEGMDVRLPTVTAASLGFIVNELITNAAKYGEGGIVVRLEPSQTRGYALSVSNDGPSLPEGFDPTASKGLGMKIIRSCVRRISGELLHGRGDNNRGTRFTILFS